jgi:hypothetical protein
MRSEASVNMLKAIPKCGHNVQVSSESFGGDGPVSRVESCVNIFDMSAPDISVK